MLYGVFLVVWCKDLCVGVMCDIRHIVKHKEVY